MLTDLLLLPFRLLAIAGGIALIALIILPALALSKVSRHA